MKERSAILTFAGGRQRQGEYKSEKQGDVVCSEHMVSEFTAPERPQLAKHRHCTD
jgi:hypothetical protein